MQNLTITDSSDMNKGYSALAQFIVFSMLISKILTEHQLLFYIC